MSKQSRYRANIFAGAFVMAMLSFPLHAATVRVGGTGAGLGTMHLLAAEFSKASPGDSLQVIPNLGTGGGLKALAAGALDMAVIARPLKPGEAAGGLQALVYGRTPFVIATSRNGAGPINSVAELGAFVSGARTTWPGGLPVRLVLRPLQDSDTEALGDFSPEIKAAIPAALARPGMIVAATDQEAADAVEKMPGALGTTTLALVISEKRQVTLVPINGVVPSARAVADGTYTHFKTMHVASKVSPAPVVARFLDFLASPAARKVIADAGHASPVNPQEAK